ncbi:MAG: AAA family ATPase [Bacteroidetes bacterium]|nr:AAA family ATPase [Bacteroidota bacterium]
MEEIILEIQDKLFEHLSKILSINEGFKFSLRKSNLGNKLDRRYWFHGGINYVAISFWSGFDNVNRTPNISFIINQDESCFILFSARNSDLVNKFFLDKLYPALGFSQIISGNQLKIPIEGPSSYLEKIDDFIKQEKVEIDGILKKEIAFFADRREPGIGFIDGRDFRLLYNRAVKLRNAINQIQEPRLYESSLNISKLTIKNFGPISNFDLPNFGLGKKWIFLTGENGCGKSAIFRAIAAAICNDHSYLTNGDYSNYEVSIHITDGQKTFNREFNAKNAYKDNPKLLYRGFAAYGASRLTIEDTKQNKTMDTYHLTACDSIFKYCNPLLDLWTRIIEIQKRKGSSIAHVRIDNIREMFYSLIENLQTILFPGEFDDDKTYYAELDIKNNKGFLPVPYDYLASGIRSIIAMIGDLIVRFFDQQPNALSPGDFKGIVIIDEIDVHLHPSYQKKIVEALDIIFPKVQFLVSTHSPIPFLGAPKSSAIYVVKRDYKEGVLINRIDDKIYIQDLLPNTILTSPIFDLDEITNEHHETERILRTEKTFAELEFNDKVKAKINLFMNDTIESELISIFEKRRK